MKKAFCTIISSNYMPQALVLINSFKKFHSNDQFYLLVIDVEIVHQQFIDGVTILTPNELKIEELSLEKMRRYYDLVELATSLKPFLLEVLIAEGASEATYLDPDVQVFSEITFTRNPISTGTLALTPHRLSPPNQHALKEGEKLFLKYGVFNLGYISVTPKDIDFLQWWKEHLVIQSTRWPISEVFTDQKWIDLVPGYFDYIKVSDYGFNVAPWNLDERELTLRDEILFVNKNTIVKFVHFSQISGMLSKGGLSARWLTKLENSGLSEETSIVFGKLLQRYTIELAMIKKNAYWNSYFKLLVNPYSKLNYLMRQRIFRELQKSNSIVSKRDIDANLFLKLLDLLLTKLTRFDSFNGLAWGVRSDIARIMSKKKIP